MIEATCWPDKCFCETINPDGLAQIVNSWSAFAFVAIGVLILLFALKHKTTDANILTSKKIYSIIYTLILIFIGIGTFYYHATLGFVGQFFDILGMYFLATFFLFYLFTASHDFGNIRTIGLFLAGNFILALIIYYYPQIRRQIFALLILLILFFEIRRRKGLRNKINTNYLYWAIITLVLGFTFWLLDLTKIICEPQSLIQGHALWHILTAVSAGLIYLYYSSEKSEV